MTNLWASFVHPISRYMRRKRARQILQLYPDFSNASVLDLGGSRHYWEKMIGLMEPKSLTVLNVEDDGQAVSYSNLLPNLKIEIYDGIKIPYPDDHFDVVFCNSVIEHVPPALRQNLVNEIRRTGRTYFVQTPSYYFPVEPHFVMPFVHWLPRAIGRKLVRISLYAILSKATPQKLDAYFDEVHLLSAKELKGYAPEATLVPERLLGLTKSYTLVNLAPQA
ncbi:class I SAM-dependent methyltransferase [Neorhizobium sp. JUb45]|uniref:class I SAM-dependent methyltransferase n=1 Tax=unclassified Neorhizobium TaxID=2629175 RepID=UPI001047CF64|nr:class I SAM-dependent methyltransferase [Neorhizobium sp. JUb45]TCQ98231.1 methyltransferase family protein [Neorhizobium sp. JUb45]